MKPTSRSHRQTIRIEALEQRQLFAAPLLTSPIEGLNFDSTQAASSIYVGAPGVGTAAGPTHILNVVGTAIQWHTKSGTRENTQRLGRDGAGSSAGSFFVSLSPNSTVLDAKAVYDSRNGRFVVVGVDNAPGTSQILMAVSDDADPNGTWYFSKFDSTTNFGGQNCFASSLGLGFSEQGLYVTAGMFSFASQTYMTNRFWVIHKTPWYAGGVAGVSAGQNVNNLRLLQPAQMFTDSHSVDDMFFCSFVDDAIELFGVRDAFTVPTIQTHSSINFGDIDNGLAAVSSVPQPGTSATILVDDKRLQNLVYQDGVFVTCNTIMPTTGPDTGTATAHWYAFDNFGMRKQGNVGGEDIAPGTRTFFPSVMIDEAFNVAMSFSASGPQVYPGAFYAAGANINSAATMQPSAVLAAGADYYIRDFGLGNQWGPRSSIALDPSGKHFWLYNQYAVTRGTVAGTGDGRWATRNGRITCFPATVTGTVFADFNNDGVKNGIDHGVGNSTVWADLDNNGAQDGGEPAALTGSGGAYTLENVPEGAQNLRLTTCPGHFAVNNPTSINLAGGETTTGVDLVVVPIHFNDSAGSDNTVLGKTGSQLYVTINGLLTILIPTNVPSLTFEFANGNDTLTIDGTNGSPIPACGISVLGGNGTDSLIANGTAGIDSFSLSGNAVTQGGVGTISYTSVESLTLNGLGSQDTFNVQSVAAGTSATINGGDGQEVVNIYDSFTGALAVSGGAGFDQLNFNGSPGEDTFVAAANAIQKGAAVISLPAQDFESLVMNGNGGDTTFNVNGTAPGAALTLNGGEGRDVTVLHTLDAARYPAPITFNAGTGTMDEIELDDTASDFATYFFNSTSVTKDNGFGGLSYSNVELMYLADGTASTNTSSFEVSNTPANLQLHIDGGIFSDIYNVLASGTNSAVWLDSNPYGDVINVNGVVRQSVSFLFAAHLLIGAGGVMHVEPGANRVLRTTNLAMIAGGTLDLNDGALIYEYGGSSPVATVAAQLTTGYANGAWNGTGIRSSTAAATPNCSLGYAEASDLFTSFPVAFAGQLIDSTALLVRYTLGGDTNLDQRVDITDLGNLATKWQQSSQRWSQGNFNFDQIVNITDLGLLATNWQKNLPVAAAARASESTRRVPRMIEQIL